MERINGWNGKNQRVFLPLGDVIILPVQRHGAPTGNAEVIMLGAESTKIVANARCEVFPDLKDH